MSEKETWRAACCVAVMTAGAGAQVAWQQLTTPVAPAPRAGHAMSAEPLGRVLLFGGGNFPTYYGDTWTWDWQTWRQLAPAHSPRTRSGHALAFDRLRNRVVLFGGNASQGSVNVTLNDTWEWDGVDWIAVSPATSPSLRTWNSMAFDLPRGRTVLFGGVYIVTNQTPVTFADTWTWDGTVWRNVPTPTTPPARGGTALAGDLSRGNVVMFGGRSASGLELGDTWTFDGSNWLQQLPAHVPPPRQFSSMVFDQARGRAVLFGGRVSSTNSELADTWEWDGVDWQSRLPTGSSPSRRQFAAMMFEPANGRVVLFGGGIGAAPSPLYADTWAYGPDPSPIANPFGAGCAGTSGTPQLTGNATGVGATLQLTLSGLSNSPFAGLVTGLSRTLWGTTLLPFDLGVYGMPGCQLLASPDVSQLLVASRGTAVHGTPVPANPLLAGIQVYLQGISFDAAANLGGVVVSNGLEVRIGGG